MSFEVSQPILNAPFAEPTTHWYIQEGKDPEQRVGRRPALVYPPRDERPDRRVPWSVGEGTLDHSKEYAPAFELTLVNLIRQRIDAWRKADYAGVTRTTYELLRHWNQSERLQPLFFAQREAAETIIFLKEARSDLLQGIKVPRDDPSPDKQAEGFTGFARYACKMATGSGKTTVMGMLAAWSILNKVQNRGDARFSDVVLAVCPNVTIRDRLQEIDPERGESSLYRTRDLVPAHLMTDLRKGKVLVTNWHVFDAHLIQAGGVPAKVSRAGEPRTRTEKILIGTKTTTARGKRYWTRDVYEIRKAAGDIEIVDEKRDDDGEVIQATITYTEFVESDTALVQRILGRAIGGKQNILVLNDEAHHAYRIRKIEDEDDDDQGDLFEDDDEAEEFFQEATIWVDGLDRIHKKRGINFCVDVSATPYFLGRVGRETNRPFPWVVSDFGLMDAIESGLVKIPQLAVRDSTGEDIPGYFNIWHWIIPKLTPAERGGRRANPRVEAILKWADHPIRMLAGLWEKELEDWQTRGEDRPPVFILVCKTTALAKAVFEWIAEDNPPTGIPSAKIADLRNKDGRVNTIRVDSKVVHESDSGEAKGDETRWMRFTLDTVGRKEWPRDRQGRILFPEGFEDLAKKLERPAHPPGRDVRCIISVGMLTEGWDCNTVTHIIGLRPFMSQLLCEQVVGRGLRRRSYTLDKDGKFTEEVAKVFGVPFEVIPFKANPSGPAPPPPPKHHVHALPGKAKHEIQFPRVEGYTRAIRNRVAVDWANAPMLVLEPGRIPPEVEMKAMNINNKGRMSLAGPGRVDDVSLADFRAKRRIQELVFDLAKTLTQDFVAQRACEIPAHVLFPQLVGIVQRFLDEKVRVSPPADLKDVFLAPYYGWIIERLLEAIGPDISSGEAAEIPRYEASRGPGTTGDVDYWTSRDVREVLHCHVNYVVADTGKWEQQAAYRIDKHPKVVSFAKNAGLGFAIPYLHNGQMHDYYPDFVIALKCDSPSFLILETKGYDPLEDVKRAAAERWVNAVNAEGSYGRWRYAVVKDIANVEGVVNSAWEQLSAIHTTPNCGRNKSTGSNS